MNRLTMALTVVMSVTTALPAVAQQYVAKQAGDVVQLQDTRNQTEVSLVPSVGNLTFELKVKGHNVLFFPYATLAEFKQRPGLTGIPFMGPWANRLDEQAFYANGKRYAFDMELGNVRGNIPIHGFLSTTDQWKVLEVKADGRSAWVRSRLDVFAQPTWMKQWPFAHSIEIVHRLQNGVLEVNTRITNMSGEPMPVSIGFHPYFQLTDSKREEWKFQIGARTQWVLAGNKVPTGETLPIEQLIPAGAPAALNDYNLDDVFSDLVRDAQGRSTMSLIGRQQRLDVMLGPNYKSVVVYAPHPNNVGRGSQVPAGGRGAGPGPGGATPAVTPPAQGAQPAQAAPATQAAQAPAQTAGAANPAQGAVAPQGAAPATAPQAAAVGAGVQGGRGGRGGGGPQNRNFICFEPMAGITNAINLAHKGIYKELQTVPAGGTWQESFWVRPSGF